MNLNTRTVLVIIIILSAWNFQLHPMSGDGNCLFSTVAFALKANAPSLNLYDSNFIVGNKLEISDLKKLGMRLRDLMVKEWKDNASYYQSFLTSTTVDIEAGNFLRSGYYFGELSDTMVLALSNALKLPIIVFTSIQHHPVINILPREVANPVTLCIAYNQYGPGHYDGLTVNEKESDAVSQDAPASRCTCGKNDKSNNTHCHPKTHKYSTVCYCSCYNSKKGCSDYCKCKSCDNPLRETHCCGVCA
ncbi:hypothetical protein SPBRAN_1617 [uncultured Candidatus Thioglobus sp.]|nr:hypothetical protein SPBRAN_1617 [uncultured Candidatus Thioglobus sp.]